MSVRGSNPPRKIITSEHKVEVDTLQQGAQIRHRNHPTSLATLDSHGGFLVKLVLRGDLLVFGIVAATALQPTQQRQFSGFSQKGFPI